MRGFTAGYSVGGLPEAGPTINVLTAAPCITGHGTKTYVIGSVDGSNDGDDGDEPENDDEDKKHRSK